MPLHCHRLDLWQKRYGMSFQLKAQNPKGSTNHYFHHRHLLQRNHLRLHTWRITRQVSGTIEKANHNTHTALQDLENALNKISILRLSLTENFDIAKFPKIEIAFLLKALELPGHHRGKLASGQKKKKVSRPKAQAQLTVTFNWAVSFSSSPFCPSSSLTFPVHGTNVGGV